MEVDMTRSLSCWAVSAWTLLAVSCTSGPEESARIPVARENGAGVVALEVQRYEDRGDRVFELRGIDDNGLEAASVRLRLGVIGDLVKPDTSPLGSELTVAAGDASLRIVSRDQELFYLVGPFEPALDEFLSIAEVAKTLEKASIVTVAPPDVEEVAFDMSAPASYLNQKPPGLQACYTGEIPIGIGGGSIRFTKLVDNTTPPKVVERLRSYNGMAKCASSSGGSCSGTSCYFGPNYHASPRQITGTSPNVYPLITNNGICGVQWYSSPPTPVWPTVTGTFPNGCGCCVNGSGNVCNTGSASSTCTAYPACTTCGGGGSNGAIWD
jgi:hypothetical protein